jgi:serine phosphatase RsbU (regulator of sigma subunit)/anti-sigma regulatory factor (Ser/Thr protein kinase)
LFVAGVGLTVTAGLWFGAARSIDEGRTRSLESDLRQVASDLQASMPSIQQPLFAGAQIAATAGIERFRDYEETEVPAPFRSVSLWAHTPEGLRLLKAVGAAPEVLHGNPAVLAALRAVRPSGRLNVLGLVHGPARALALAELLPGRGLLVYAEDTPPDAATLSNSPLFSGLHFSLYDGPTATPSRLIETDTADTQSGPSRTETVRFGSGLVTIRAILTARPPGTLPSQVPPLIAVGGLALTAAATATAELLVRRREIAERAASDTGLAYDELKGISETLQHTFLPPDDLSFPGVELAGAYVAGVQPLGVGGDWYDAIPIDETHLFVSVGDVAGRGHDAARVMSSLRHAIRAYAVQGDPPGTVIRKLGELVDVERDDCFATVLAAAVDVPGRTIEVVSAGHLPPLLVDDAGARYLSLTVAIPVGMARRAPLPPPPARLALSPGSTLVFFTDGLVERRGEVVDVGLEQLRDAAAATQGDARDVVADLLRAVVPDGCDDDLALLALRWPSVPADDLATPTVPPAGWAHRRRFPREPESAERARVFVAGCLEAAPRDVREVAKLLTSELASNAVLHARSAFDVVVSEARGTVRVAVIDAGPGEPVPERTDDGRDGGHGLWIVSRLSDRWGVDHLPGGAKSVWFESAVRSGSPSSRRAR